MPSPALLAEMDAVLARFEEAAAAAQKWRIVGKEEKRLEKAISQAFKTQGRAFLRGFATMRPLFESVALREEWDDDDWIEIFDDAAGDTHTAFLKPIQKGVQTALLAGANNIIGQVKSDIAFNLRNPRAVAYIEQHGAALVSGIEDTTRDYIRTVMTSAAAEGWSYDRAAKTLADRFEQFAVGAPQEHIESRAHLIAITEIGNAYEAGNEIVVEDLQASGVDMEKKWLTTGDDRVSEGCEENEDEGWIPYEDEHASGDMHPLRFPGCRCTELYRRAR